MPEQKFCSKCGKTNWSYFAKTCECRKPDFKYDTYEEYLSNKSIYTLYKDDDFYGRGGVEHIEMLIRHWIDDHLKRKGEVTFTIK